MRRYIPNRIALLQKARPFKKVLCEQKREVKKFFYYKRIWKTQEKIKLRFIQEP